MKTLPDWQAMPCAEFVDWIDRTYRVDLVTRLLNADRRLAEIQANESWNRLLIHVYQGNFTGERWANLEHLIAWCWTWLRKDAWFLVSNERQARGIIEGRDRKAMYLLSELEVEQIEQAMSQAVYEPTKAPEMSPGGEGWLDQLLDDLTPKQRQVVELTIVGDWTPTQAAEHLGRSAVNVRSTKKHAIDGMRKRVESGRVAVPGYGGGAA